VLILFLESAKHTTVKSFGYPVLPTRAPKRHAPSLFKPFKPFKLFKPFKSFNPFKLAAK
jgi:hypothetical protein